MHAVRQDQELQAVTRITGRPPKTCVQCSVFGVRGRKKARNPRSVCFPEHRTLNTEHFRHPEVLRGKTLPLKLQHICGPVLHWAAAVLAAGSILATSGGATAAPLQIEPESENISSGTANTPTAQDGQKSARGNPATGTNRDAGDGNKAPKENPAARRNKKRATPGKDEKTGRAKKKPSKVALPSQGVYKASEIARLASRISGRAVQIGDTGVERRRIEIIPLLAGQTITLEELKLLLAFHGIYLFDSVDPEDGEVLVATTDPRWHPRQGRYTRVIEVPALGFKRVWRQLKAAIDEHNAANATRAQREADVIGVPVESVGKIFLRAPNRKTLSRLVQLAERANGEKPRADRVKLFAYTGQFRRVRDLERDVVEQLTEGERVKARFVVMRTGNRLLYRAPGRLGERITNLLAKLDRRRN